MADYEFDVALSFAGEDRAYVHQVATTLRDRGVEVFYDEFKTVELWGQNLYSYLDDVYRHQCRYAIVFTSASYARGMWTSHERQSIQARLMEEPSLFLLLVRLDGHEIAGFRPMLGYLDGQRLTPATVAEHVIARLEHRPGVDLTARSVRVPLNDDEKRRILAIRPAGWEHLILAGTIWQERERLETKRLDHELGFAAGTRHYISGDQVHDLMRSTMDELTLLLSKLDKVVGGDRLPWAMGAPGTAGDAVRIQHLGRRFGTAFEDLLDWAARVRATVCAPAHRSWLDLLASLADAPVRGVGDFVGELVTVAGQLADAASARATDDVPRTIRLDLTMDVATLEAFRVSVIERTVP